MGFDFFQQAKFIEFSHYSFTGSKTLQTLELFWNCTAARISRFAIGIKYFRFGTDITVESQNVDHRQGVAFTDFIVIKIVRWRDFYTTGAFFHVGVFISEDRNTATHQR
ncbi:Uncharacterised protein [Yersinia enterocolitica]|nr:Uncharacterised protein [Yersinia enterocolitica]